MEKRKEFRVRKRILVRVGNGRQPHYCFTGDLSPHGIFLQTPYVYPTGQALSLALLPDDREIALAGRVAWSKKAPISSFLLLNGGMGVLLDDGGSEEFQRLLKERPS